MESSTQNKKILDNKYIIQEKMGYGATANVYKVIDKNTNNVYAAKVLKKESEHFENEIQILKLLHEKNPYMINLVDSGCGQVIKDGFPSEKKQYIILEYAPKGELFDYISCPKKGFGEKYAKIIFRNILKGINYCHKKGICHRDIKIDNILLDENFNPKICDFGFATLTQGKDGSGILRTPLGTIDYCAPEILLKRSYKGMKADVFSSGVILMNLVTGKKGFNEATKLDYFYRLIMTKHYNQYWDEISKVIGRVPLTQEFKNLFINMICFDPNRRYEIDYILEKDPWLEEVRRLTKEELENLEEEIKNEFKDREKMIKKKRAGEKMEVNSDSGSDSGCNTRSVGDLEYFSLDLKPKHRKTGINMKDFVKIDGEIKPNKFMNSVINLLKTKKNCDFDYSKKVFKFIVNFGDEEQKEEENIPKELEEELKALNLDEKNDNENEEDDEEVTKVVSSIEVKLYESTDRGYIVRFVKKSGTMEEYYQNLDVIKEVIRNIINYNK